MRRLKYCRNLALLACACGLFAIGMRASRADEATDKSRSWSERIDQRIEEKLHEQSIVVSGPCDDATFLRRATLDLTGRNPTAGEVVAFLKDPHPQKRRLAIDRLLASPQCAAHLANIWSTWLLPEMQNAIFFGNDTNGLQNWLRNRFADNLRYDRLVADLLVANGTAATGPGAFFLALEGKPEKIAAKTARVFLGVQLDCAECHDHPFDHWKQRDFWGFAAYFAQLSAASMEGNIGRQSVGDLEEGEVKLPNTEEVIAPRPLVSTGQSSLESGSRRQQLTLWLTARENPYLARAAVNRAWSILFGRGLIEPIDDMRSMEMASHPELLRELSEAFSANGFDLRDLLRALANTRAYARASIPGQSSEQSASAADPTNLSNSYATMPVKPLTSTQLANCMLQVAREITGDQARLQSLQLAQQLGKLRGDNSAATLGIVQALVTLHSDSLNPVHEQNRSRLLQALSAPHLDDKQRVEWMFLCTLARRPTTDELAGIEKLRTNSSIDSSKGAERSTTESTIGNSTTESTSDTAWQSDLLWALINSTEFAMTP